ncbi:protein phosphatase 1 regulatory subunit 3C-B isoform X4 [Hypanus sabinus]|uniref:protein phosphatase 1 regulatory subunit 3C-B isoform X4 n=1 Tax=Hypanus sabinus TaxID=79690 RepID=UPI0028C3B10E|nr:protein phosphatase 1 regulatory subunit 3C-B isoform X4 [Hypanus sabinus]
MAFSGKNWELCQLLQMLPGLLSSSCILCMSLPRAEMLPFVIQVPRHVYQSQAEIKSLVFLIPCLHSLDRNIKEIDLKVISATEEMNSIWHISTEAVTDPAAIPFYPTGVMNWGPRLGPTPDLGLNLVWDCLARSACPGVKQQTFLFEEPSMCLSCLSCLLLLRLGSRRSKCEHQGQPRYSRADSSVFKFRTAHQRSHLNPLQQTSLVLTMGILLPFSLWTLRTGENLLEDGVKCSQQASSSPRARWREVFSAGDLISIQRCVAAGRDSTPFSIIGASCAILTVVTMLHSVQENYATLM